jgi:tripartite-type tricarboxylate transporter receptor subunit TctC
MIRRLIAVVMMTVSFSSYSAQNSIELVTSFPPGGWIDLVSRETQQYLQQKLRRPVVLQYKVGANGKIAADYVLSQPSSANTFLIMPTGSLMGKVTDPDSFPEFTEFNWTIPIATTSAVMAVNNKIGVTNLKEFVSLANTKKLNCGSSTGAATLFGQYIFKKLNIETQIVPFKGSSDLHAQLFGGHVDCGFDSLVALEEAIKAKQVNLILTGTPVKDYPVKTFNDIEPGLKFGLFIGIAGPTKHYGADQQLVLDAMKDMHKDPVIKAKLNKARVDMPVPGDLQYIQKEYNFFKSVSREISK